MPSFLVEVTPDILDVILGFVYSQATLDLWLCGNKRLQNNIAQGVTTIHLLNTQKFTLNRFPLIITQLPKLRSLIIDRDYNDLLYYRQVSKHIQRLPPTLTKLALRYDDSCTAFSPADPDHSDLDPSTDPTTTEDVQTSLKDAFPLLETLEIANCSPFDVSTLPPHLTSLAIGLPFEEEEQEDFIRGLPRELLHLTLIGLARSALMQPLLWEHLPRNLLTFNCRNENLYFIYDGSEAALLPRTLTKLKVPLVYEVDSPEQVKALPSGLTSLNQILFGDDSLITPEIGLTLPSLTRVSFRSLSPTLNTRLLIRNLPKTVTILNIPVDMSTMEKSDWPVNLKELELGRRSKLLGNFRHDALPSGLLTLSLSSVVSIRSLSEMSLLPRSLTKFRSYYHLPPQNLPIDFPPQLTDLSLINEFELDEERNTKIPCFPFHSLPRSLTSLKTSIPIMASQLKDLPRLLALDASFIHKDLDFNPQDELRWMLSSPTHRDRHLERFDWNALSEASITSLLPRSLTELHLNESPIGQAPLDWEHLPPLVSSLSVGSRYVGLAEWHSLSKLPLKDLRVRLESFDDECCKATTRGMESLSVEAQDISGLSARGVASLPPSISFDLEHPESKSIQDIHEKRVGLFRAALQANEPETFFKLMKAHDNVDFCLSLLQKE